MSKVVHLYFDDVSVSIYSSSESSYTTIKVGQYDTEIELTLEPNEIEELVKQLKNLL